MELCKLLVCIVLAGVLLEQVQGFTESQRQHVPASIMAVLYNVASLEENSDAGAEQEQERGNTEESGDKEHLSDKNEKESTETSS